MSVYGVNVSDDHRLGCCVYRDDDRRCSSPPGDKGSMDIGTEIEPPAPTKPKVLGGSHGNA